ncbi:type IX secretion system sortase PorU [Aureibacter tunicatorum]|uniref:type IX secretion system sortase PorU n=1 Tax=Aureibacter tunicatorum TaxID=866807 RepID=UPI00286C59A0|nr:type IX secretion system sortase PorU [Aureibacter tunicatorum]
MSFFLLVVLPFIAEGQSRAVDKESVLRQDDWYKFAVLEEGIYKLDKTFFDGIGMAGADPRNIAVYSSRSGALPQKNLDKWDTDLQECSVEFVGENDGRLDANDYLLFYGQGAYSRKFENGYEILNSNPYDDTVFYFVVNKSIRAKRITVKQVVGVPTSRIRSFSKPNLHEESERSLVVSGRNRYGDKVSSGSSKSIVFEGQSLVAGGRLTLDLSLLSVSGDDDLNCKVTLNGKSSFDVNIRKRSKLGDYPEKGVLSIFNKTFSSDVFAGDQNLEVLFHVNSGDLRIDNVKVSANNSLRAFNGALVFDNSAVVNGEKVVDFHLQGFERDIRVWDISNPLHVQSLKVTNNIIIDSANHHLNYFAFDNSYEYKQVQNVQRVANQNLHGDKSPEMVIVTLPEFKDAASDLAAFRRAHDGLSVKIVTPNQIYNEFSAGRLDPSAIRDYMYYLYHTGGNKLKYLLLMGKTSYDYKNLDGGGTNFVPSYQTENSYHPVRSYVTDDYFGLLEDEDGDWLEGSLSKEETMEIAIGRLPVTSLEQASDVVEKIKRYQTSAQSVGEWRHRVTFVSDDGDSHTHLRDAEDISSYIYDNHPQYTQEKIYLANYTKEGGSPYQGERELDNAVEDGSFIINYIGHGNERNWAEEGVLRMDMIRDWNNLDRLPLFITATCEFGRHDDPLVVSGAEEILLNPNGGGIALVTTSRPVYSSSNKKINLAFNEHVLDYSFEYKPTLGEIFKRAKNAALPLQRDRNRGFILLGDPSMTLAYPERGVKLSEINGKKVGLDDITLKALDKVNLKGNIFLSQGVVDTLFNGEVVLKLYDKPFEQRTNGVKESVINYINYNNVVNSVRAKIVKGSFELEFIIPKNIDYKIEESRMTMYAFEEGSHVDGGDAFVDFSLGGTSDNFVVDDKNPEVLAFINDFTFVSGDKTGKDIVLLARLFDESGLSLSKNNVGQIMMAVLDEDEEFILVDHFIPEIDDFTRGEVRFPISDLEEGKHLLKVKAWDVHNNAGEGEVEFYVVSSDGLTIFDLYNYPNPVAGETTISFSHNRAGEDLIVSLSLYNSNGQLIFEREKEIFNSSQRVEELKWDSRLDSRNYLAPGVYIYQINVKSQKDGKNAKEFSRLVLIKQK